MYLTCSYDYCVSKRKKLILKIQTVLDGTMLARRSNRRKESLSPLLAYHIQYSITTVQLYIYVINPKSQLRRKGTPPLFEYFLSK